MKFSMMLITCFFAVLVGADISVADAATELKASYRSYSYRPSTYTYTYTYYRPSTYVYTYSYYTPHYTYTYTGGSVFVNPIGIIFAICFIVIIASIIACASCANHSVVEHHEPLIGHTTVVEHHEGPPPFGIPGSTPFEHHGPPPFGYPHHGPPPQIFGGHIVVENHGGFHGHH